MQKPNQRNRVPVLTQDRNIELLQETKEQRIQKSNAKGVERVVGKLQNCGN